MKNISVICIALLVNGLSISAFAENPAEVPAFGSSFASLGFLDRESSTVLPETILAEPGTIEGFRLGGPTTELRVVQIEEERYAIRLGDSEVAREFPAAYDGFAAFKLDLDDDGRDEVLVESGWGRGTSVYQRSLTAYRVVDGDFKPIFDVTLNDYFPVVGEPYPGGWARRYRLLRDGDSGPVEIMLVLEIPAVPVATYDANAQIAMSRREMRFKLDGNGVYRLSGEL